MTDNSFESTHLVKRRSSLAFYLMGALVCVSSVAEPVTAAASERLDRSDNEPQVPADRLVLAVMPMHYGSFFTLPGSDGSNSAYQQWKSDLAIGAVGMFIGPISRHVAFHGQLVVAEVLGGTWEDEPTELVAVTMIRADVLLEFMLPFYHNEIAFNIGLGVGGHMGHESGPGIGLGAGLGYTRWLADGQGLRASVDGRAGIYGQEGHGYINAALEVTLGYVWCL